MQEKAYMGAWWSWKLVLEDPDSHMRKDADVSDRSEEEQVMEKVFC